MKSSPAAEGPTGRKDVTEGQSYREKVGEQILPEFCEC